MNRYIVCFTLLHTGLYMSNLIHIGGGGQKVFIYARTEVCDTIDIVLCTYKFLASFRRGSNVTLHTQVEMSDVRNTVTAKDE